MHGLKLCRSRARASAHLLGHGPPVCVALASAALHARHQDVWRSVIAEQHPRPLATLDAAQPHDPSRRSATELCNRLGQRHRQGQLGRTWRLCHRSGVCARRRSAAAAGCLWRRASAAAPTSAHRPSGSARPSDCCAGRGARRSRRRSWQSRRKDLCGCSSSRRSALSLSCEEGCSVLTPGAA